VTETLPLSKIIDGFSAGAQAACALLDTSQPDLVLALMHAGDGPATCNPGTVGDDA
jgi:hypothetical protein